MPRRSRSRSRSPRRDRDRTRETRDRRDDRREGRERVDRDRVERGERVERRRDYDREFADRPDRDREDRGTRDRPDRFSRRSRSPPNFRAAPGSTGPSKPLKEEKKKIFTAEDFAGKTDEEIEMMKLMGFGGFETSKGQKVDGNDVGAVHVKLKRTYRQYMNRRGGFNRPLDAVH